MQDSMPARSLVLHDRVHDWDVLEAGSGESCMLLHPLLDKRFIAVTAKPPVP